MSGTLAHPASKSLHHRHSVGLGLAILLHSLTVIHAFRFRFRYTHSDSQTHDDRLGSSHILYIQMSIYTHTGWLTITGYVWFILPGLINVGAIHEPKVSPSWVR